MKRTFRWYGENDRVTLDQIRQIPGMTGIVSAVYDVAPGEVWSNESILAIKNAANSHGLAFNVVESVPVHEEIKLWGPDAERLTDVYCENVRRLGKAGVDCICYNFMPVFDWFRTNLKNELPDGSNSLAYDERTVLSMDPLTSDLSLPGWDESYSKEELVAELGSAALVNHCGMETASSFHNSAAYVANWLTALKNDKRLIVSAASKARKAVDLILGA